MINPSFEELEKIDHSRYALCMTASKRARKIVDGSEPLIETDRHNPVTVALEEIMAGEVTEIKPDE